MQLAIFDETQASPALVPAIDSKQVPLFLPAEEVEPSDVGLEALRGLSRLIVNQLEPAGVER